MCTGFVAADLAALCREAALRARTTGGGGADVFSVRMADLLWAHAQAIPSTQRETVLRLDRTVSWDDIGGCAEAKQVGPSSASGGGWGAGVVVTRQAQGACGHRVRWRGLARSCVALSSGRSNTGRPSSGWACGRRAAFSSTARLAAARQRWSRRSRARPAPLFSRSTARPCTRPTSAKPSVPVRCAECGCVFGRVG